MGSSRNKELPIEITKTDHSIFNFHPHRLLQLRAKGNCLICLNNVFKVPCWISLSEVCSSLSHTPQTLLRFQSLWFMASSKMFI
jgi:hypothetical protein